MDIYLMHYVMAFTLFNVYYATLLFFIAQQLTCINNDCEKENTFEIFQIVLTKFTTWGYSITLIDNVYIEILVILAGPSYMYLGRGLIMGLVQVDFYSIIKPKFLFKSQLIRSKIVMKLIGTPKEYVDLVMQFYNTFWTKRSGYYHTANMYDVLPEGLRSDITLDFYCVALKHSILFRNCDVTAMRFLSSLMEQKYYSAGETLYKKNEIKDKMIYVVSGVVEIISEEDDETPILSLSAGTCLGDTSLLCTEFCRSTVRCKDFVEVQILRRDDFVKLIKYYPHWYKKLFELVKHQYDEAKSMDKMVNFFNTSKETRKDFVTLIWIKRLMNDILCYERVDKNLLLEEENCREELETSLFSTKYLDTLALAQRAVLTRSEIIHMTFPFIMHPTSTIRMLWECTVLICTLYVLYYLPRFMFRNDNPAFLSMPIFETCSYVYMFDIYMQLTTAVFISDSSYTTLTTIMWYRFSTKTFLLDLLAALPFEIFTSIYVQEISPYSNVILRVNRFLKIHRILAFLEKLEENLLSYFYVIILLKYVVSVFYVVYLSSCFMYSSVCSYPPKNCTYSNEYWTLFTAMQTVTGIGVLGEYDREYHFGLAYLFATQLGTIVLTVLFMYVVVVASLNNPNRILVQTIITELQSDFENSGIDKHLANRVFEYVETHYQYNEGIDLLDSFKIREVLPNILYKQVIEPGYWKILKRVRFFKGLDDAFLHNLSSTIRTHVLPPDEIICYAGDMSDLLIIVKNGLCKIKDSSKNITRECVALNPLAFAYKLPIRRTRITVTHCVLLLIAYDEMIGKFKQNQVFYEAYMKSIKSTSYIKTALHEMDIESTMHNWQKQKIPSFLNFGYHFELDSIEEYEYYVPYDRLKYFNWVRHLLLHFTIHPNGNFFFLWESMRAFLAIVSAMMHTVFIFVLCHNCYAKYILYTLDATAVADIYLRLHVAYYNETGILIWHPLKTAIHYVTHGFLFDLLGVFPFEIFDTGSYDMVPLLLNMNRALQVNRYCQFIRYIYDRNLKQKSIIFHLHYVPIILIFITTISSIVVSIVCKFDTNSVFVGKIKCDVPGLAISPMKLDGINGQFVQLHIIYLVTSVINTIGFHEEVVSTFVLGLVLGLCALGGIFYTYLIMGKSAIYSNAFSATQAFYQSSMRHLKEFMKWYHVKEKAKTEIIDHYNLKWVRQRGKGIAAQSKGFYFTLKQDLAFHIYARTVYENSILPQSKKFYRNILISVKQDTYPKNTKILCENDVNALVYIVYRGIVSVFNSEGDLITMLNNGSIFGNIYGTPYHKQEVTCEAAIDCELLYIPSTEFHSILNMYPHLIPALQNLIDENAYFIPSKMISVEDTIQDDKPVRSKFTSIKEFVLHHVYHPHSTGILIWETILFVACYFAVIAYLYQLVFNEFNLYFVLAQYIFDFVYILDNFVQDRIMYVDKQGRWVSAFQFSLFPNHSQYLLVRLQLSYTNS